MKDTKSGTCQSVRQATGNPSLFDVRVGDCVDLLGQMPTASVHSVITSPPYYLQRDYGHNGQIGQEQSPEAFIASLVAAFREVRRVLRPDGNLWINVSDTYAGDNRWGIPRKSLIGIPWMLAFALRTDGWIIRAENIWHKKNCTPESASDRPSRSHEQLFLLSKKPHYYYDKEPIREESVEKPPKGGRYANFASPARLAAVSARRRGGGAPSYSINVKGGKWGADQKLHGGFKAYNPRGRNKRSVWTTTTGGFKAASVGVHDVDHFAVFPPALIRPCVLAGTSEYGCCAACGSPYTRFIADYEDLEDTWLPSCSCSPDAGVVPCTVLDPFAGSGTTGLVCIEENRQFIGLEINPSYARLAGARLNHTALRVGRAVS